MISREMENPDLSGSEENRIEVEITDTNWYDSVAFRCNHSIPTLAKCYTNGACYLIRSDRAFELYGSDRLTFGVTVERIEN